ncbi:MAG: thiopurine S-methyltransferase [Myxococcales bacterium]|nr:MAG: thiopurine S-methyltransferase [Myxococcales bacterium]
MRPDYWLERWEKGRIGFHRADPNPLLVEHHERVLGGTIRVLVPLCGKSADLEWLVIQGHEVVGIELSELAARAFFDERHLTAERVEHAGFIEYRRGALSIFVGDFFAATPELTGYCDGVYDRAALIALPAELRARYAAHLPTVLAPKARALLITLHYDAEGGPPFDVSPAEVARLYERFTATPLASADARDDAPGPLARGATFVQENTYLLELP